MMYEIFSLFTTMTYIILAVEFAFGFALGYFMGKLVKALIGIMILGIIGVMLNYTQFVALTDAIVQKVGISPSQFVSVASLVLLFLGLTVIAPLTIGLIIGYFIGR